MELLRLMFNSIMQHTMAVSGVSVILAAVACFCGYKLMKLGIALISGCAGFALGVIIFPYFVTGLSRPLLLLIALNCAALCVIIALKFKALGVFVLAVILGTALMNTITFPQTESWRIISMLIWAVVAVVSGVMAMQYEQKVIIFLSAAAGSAVIVDQVKNYVTLPGGTERSTLVFFAVLLCMGVAVQWLTTKK
ncbi:MAG TPA: hypothetical protein DCM49_01820 [Lachnospiraceae bacterium]|nr:hypothetical protein [Lachnospiraceae bacterium]